MMENPDSTLLGDLPQPLRPFVADGRITSMPARRSIRLLLLNLVAQAFEPGRRYEEPVVNEVLKALHDDHAPLRRYLIDEDLMSRTRTAPTGDPAARSPSPTSAPAPRAPRAPGRAALLPRGRRLATRQYHLPYVLTISAPDLSRYGRVDLVAMYGKWSACMASGLAGIA